jgi:hypothetical protein
MEAGHSRPKCDPSTSVRLSAAVGLSMGACAREPMDGSWWPYPEYCGHHQQRCAPYGGQRDYACDGTEDPKF